MWSSKRFRTAAALAGVALLAGVSVVVSQEGRRLDRSKVELIEPVVRAVVATGSAPANRPTLDIRKTIVIEPRVKALVASGTAPAAAARPAGDFVNPKVAPGKVRWHPSLAAACDAARASKKPVLLFQLMGKLDDQFC